MSTGAVSDAISLRWPSLSGQFVNRFLPSIKFEALDVPLWAPAVLRRINELNALPSVDPYSTTPLNIPDVLAALRFLTRNMRNDTLPPWIGRLGSGGLQLTWHCGDVEVEAVFDTARDEFDVLVAVAGNEWDAPAGEAEPLFAQVVDRLSRSHFEYLSAD